MPRSDRRCSSRTGDRECQTLLHLLRPNETVRIDETNRPSVLFTVGCPPPQDGGAGSNDPNASCDWERGGTGALVVPVSPFREFFSRAKNFPIPIKFLWWAQEKRDSKYENLADSFHPLPVSSSAIEAVVMCLGFRKV